MRTEERVGAQSHLPSVHTDMLANPFASSRENLLRSQARIEQGSSRPTLIDRAVVFSEKLRIVFGRESSPPSPLPTPAIPSEAPQNGPTEQVS